MKILIVRHGEPDYEIDSLTEKGWREAEMLSHRLTKSDIKDFYVSPLGRAQDTGRVTLEKLDRSAEVLDWLREFHGHVMIPDITPGAPEGSKFEYLAWNFPLGIWREHPQMRLNEGGWLDDDIMDSGTVRKVYEETEQGVIELLGRYGFTRNGLTWHNDNNTADTICLFCHFGIGAAIISILTGLSLPYLWNNMFMPTSSVTTIVTEERLKGDIQFKVMQMGDTSHLYAEGEPVSDSGLFQEVYKEDQWY